MLRSLRRRTASMAPLVLALAVPLFGAGLPGPARAQSAPSYPLLDSGSDPAATGLVTLLSENDGVLATIVLSNAQPTTSYSVTTGPALAGCPAVAFLLQPDGSYALVDAPICPAPSGPSADTSAAVTVMTDAQGDADVTVALPASALSGVQLTSSTGDTLTAVLPSTVPGAVPAS